jgi:hypothetical protein
VSRDVSQAKTPFVKPLRAGVVTGLLKTFRQRNSQRHIALIAEFFARELQEDVLHTLSCLEGGSDGPDAD